MKVRLKAFRARAGSTFLLKVGDKMVKFSSVGQESHDIPDGEAHKLVGAYPDMLELVADAPKPKPETKMVGKAPANK